MKKKKPLWYVACIGKGKDTYTNLYIKGVNFAIASAEDTFFSDWDKEVGIWANTLYKEWKKVGGWKKPKLFYGKKLKKVF